MERLQDNEKSDKNEMENIEYKECENHENEIQGYRITKIALLIKMLTTLTIEEK